MHASDTAADPFMPVQILTGVYPPPKATYSAELRQLVGLMLRLQPAKRPSVNEILGMPFMKQHMRATLAETGYVP